MYREGEQLCKGDLSTYVPEKFVSPIWWRPAAWAAITAAIFTPPTFSLKKFWAARTALTAWTCTRRWTWGFAGILAFRSILNGGVPIDVPNLRNPEERDAWRQDNACTDPAVAGDQLLPLTAYPEADVPDEVYERVRQLWLEGRDAE